MCGSMLLPLEIFPISCYSILISSIPTLSSDFPVMLPINITTPGVAKLLKDFKVQKVPDPDGLIPKVLKECASSIIAPIHSDCHLPEINLNWRISSRLAVNKCDAPVLKKEIIPSQQITVTFACYP